MSQRILAPRSNRAARGSGIDFAIEVTATADARPAHGMGIHPPFKGEARRSWKERRFPARMQGTLRREE
jgi:hypothetical protein